MKMWIFNELVTVGWLDKWRGDTGKDWHYSFVWCNFYIVYYNRIKLTFLKRCCCIFHFSSKTKMCMSMLCILCSCSASLRVFQALILRVFPIIFNLLSTPSWSLSFVLRLDPQPELHQNTFLLLLLQVCEIRASRSSVCDMSLRFIILSHLGSRLRCGEHSCWLPGWNASTPIPSTHPHMHNFWYEDQLQQHQSCVAFKSVCSFK